VQNSEIALNSAFCCESLRLLRRADDEQYLATKGREVTVLGITQCLTHKKTEVTVSRKVNVNQKNSPTGSARADDEQYKATARSVASFS